MELFSALPEDCISEIISRTSPRDACRASSISWGFKLAVDSDAVRDRFLPSDYMEILSISDSPVVYSSKKHLYFLLSDSHINLKAGKMSFSLDKESGKKCFMQSARELVITWTCTSRYWDFISGSELESRFEEVARLRSVCWLHIRGKVGRQMFSPKTTYGAFLVFKFEDGWKGLKLAKTVIKFSNGSEDVWSTVDFRSPTHGGIPHGQYPQQRKDGWKELKIGEFFNDLGDDGEVEAQLMEIENGNWKSGLLVEGIEFRPI